MAFPTPDRFKELIPNVNGSLCDKFVSSLGLPRAVHELVSSIIGDDAKLTQEFIDAICAAGCAGTGTGGDGDGTTLLPPTSVMATDGDHSDKVRVTWPGASGATSYLVYRNTVNSSATAAFLAEVVSTNFEDVTAEIGTTYYYWVKSKNPTQTSAFSVSDSGFRAAVLDTITDLAASQGFEPAFDSIMYIRLVFTPPAGAEQYDFYRNTVNDFSSAQLLDEDRSPFDNTDTLNVCPVLPCSGNVFIDNGGELVYLLPIATANQYTRYYFWVRARKVTMPAISAPSNSAPGWAVGFGDGVPPVGSESLVSGSELTINGGINEAWIVLFGGGAGGAGGSLSFGGGGAGGAATIWGKMSVAGGVGKFRVRSVPVAGLIGGTASTNGDDGYETLLEYSADGNPLNYVAVMTCDVPLGGLFNGGGGGAGGAGASGSTTVDITDPVIKDGRDGKPGSGFHGGRSGYNFGGLSHPAVRYFSDGNGSARPVVSDFNRTGSGSDADTALGTRSIGVDPLVGSAVFCWRTV